MMTHIKTAEKRLKEKYGMEKFMSCDDSEWCDAYESEIKELRAALEQAQKDNLNQKDLILKFQDQYAKDQKRIAELEAQTQDSKEATPAQPIEPDYNDMQLAEMIMSDCGLSTRNSESLVERIAGRIAKHMAVPQEILSNGLTQEQTDSTMSVKGLSQSAQPIEPYVKGWKHSCNALLTDGVELWVNRCPHCGKPATQSLDTQGE